MKIETTNLNHVMEKATGGEPKTKTSFADTLKDSINKVTELHKEASTEAEKLAKMESQDLHTAMIAMEKADISFQLMMQIRNRIINAYEEIMRMQV
jgi:flagellar hook-basal body complex protein FliE